MEWHAATPQRSRSQATWREGNSIVPSWFYGIPSVARAEVANTVVTDRSFSMLRPKSGSGSVGTGSTTISTATDEPSGSEILSPLQLSVTLPNSRSGTMEFGDNSSPDEYGPLVRLMSSAHEAAEVSFEPGETCKIVSYRTNRVYQCLTILTIIVAPMYFFYIWRYRSTTMPFYGYFFFLEELVFFLLSLSQRLLMWSRQRRLVCRLDNLDPPFPIAKWPVVHICFTHYAEVTADSVRPLRHAMKQDYPPDKLVVTILDDGYFNRVKTESGGNNGVCEQVSYNVTAGGRAMEEMMDREISIMANVLQVPVMKKRREVQPESCRRSECAPGGSQVIEWHAPGLPLVRLVGRKKGTISYMKTGNLENGLWNIIEDDAPIMVVLDTDMVASRDMLQYLLPSFFEYHNGIGWDFDWQTAFVSSPQAFSNIEKHFGNDDPLSQSFKSYWRLFAQGSDAFGMVHFWGTNAAFFIPALKSSNGFVYGCITEDTCTSAQIHKFGWKSAFVGTIDLTLATGLCRETLSEMFDQRKRWAQGNAQQFLMEYAPRCILAPSFAGAPYRQQLVELGERFWKCDRNGKLPPPICENDRGVEARRARRTWKWQLLNGIMYIPTRYSLFFCLAPPLFYCIALTLSLTCQGPFHLNVSPMGSFVDFFDRIYIVIVYWIIGGLANYFLHSYEITDPNNPHSVVLREQQYEYGFCWIMFVGTVQGFGAAIMGKQPKWNSFGMAKGVNLFLELPILIAFLALVGVVGTVTTNYLVDYFHGHGLSQLPVPNDVKFERLIGCQIMAIFVLFYLWPVTRCVLADLLNLPYYVTRNALATLVACFAQVAASLAWVLLTAHDENSSK